MRPCILGIIIAAGPWLAPSTANAQSPAVRVDGLHNGASNPESDRAKLVGKLLQSRVTINLEKVRAREAIAALRAAIGIPIVGRFSDDSVGFGIDPETIVTIAVANEPAIDVLEDVLAQCSEAIECTWQIRRGYVEVGTKARLSIPAAGETRIYEIRDLMIEAPNFDSGESFRVRELREAIGASPEPGRSSTGRSQPLALAVKIVEEIVETIEPEHWDFGQPIEPTEDERVDRDNAIAQPEPAESEGDSPDAEPTSQPSSQPEQIPRAQAGVIVWASIRLWRDQLIVVAPDFIHRQIGGYPELKRESVMVDSDDLPSSSEVPHD